MACLKWSGGVEIGIPFVDADLRILVGPLNQVNAGVYPGEEYPVPGGVLNVLVGLMEYHFPREEKLQVPCGCARHESHRDVHRHLARNVRVICARYREDRGTMRAVQLRALLEGWRVDHVMNDDFACRLACSGDAAAAEKARFARLPLRHGTRHRPSSIGAASKSW